MHHLLWDGRLCQFNICTASPLVYSSSERSDEPDCGPRCMTTYVYINQSDENNVFSNFLIQSLVKIKSPWTLHAAEKTLRIERQPQEILRISVKSREINRIIKNSYRSCGKLLKSRLTVSLTRREVLRNSEIVLLFRPTHFERESASDTCVSLLYDYVITQRISFISRGKVINLKVDTEHKNLQMHV